MTNKVYSELIFYTSDTGGHYGQHLMFCWTQRNGQNHLQVVTPKLTQL